MNTVTDGNNNWPCKVTGVTNAQIAATMAGNNGLTAVRSGNERQGTITDAIGNSYNIRLPGTVAPNSLNITFTRR